MADNTVGSRAGAAGAGEYSARCVGRDRRSRTSRSPLPRRQTAVAQEDIDEYRPKSARLVSAPKVPARPGRPAAKLSVVWWRAEQLIGAFRV
jgi:hypothetical protein